MGTTRREASADTPESPGEAARARMVSTMMQELIASGEWVPSREFGALANVAASQPNRWKRAKQIIALRHRGRDLYPLYALDPHGGYCLRPVIREVISALGDGASALSVAAWLHCPSGYLDGVAPKALLRDDPERVVAAAVTEMHRMDHV